MLGVCFEWQSTQVPEFVACTGRAKLIAARMTAGKRRRRINPSFRTSNGEYKRGASRADNFCHRRHEYAEPMRRRDFMRAAAEAFVIQITRHCDGAHTAWSDAGRSTRR